MNLTQLWNTIVRGAIYRLMWRLPPWALWLIVGLAFLMALSHGHAANEMCDMQAHCYPGQTYHMDLAHPERETPPPPSSYRPQPLPPVVNPTCRIMLVREEGETMFRSVEICTLSPEREQEIRARMRSY